MAENPYFHRGPVRDRKFFFGRTTETQEILSCVHRRQSVSIVGPRRIGKTSLLFHLADPTVRTTYGLGDGYVFVYIDCQGLSGSLNESDVYQELLGRVVIETEGVHTAERGSREPMPYLGFERSLKQIVAPGLCIVFMFDEFEEIAGNGHLGRSFFNELRGLGQTDRVVYVTASTETLSDLAFRDKIILSSPFFNFFYPMWLGFVDPEEARALVDDQAAMVGFDGFDESDHAFLREIAGLHPFYLQVACYYLFEEKARGTSLTVPDYSLVRRQFAREARGHFRYAWARLSYDEQESLKKICEGRLGEFSSGDLERLEQKSLVYQGEIFSSVFAEFVLNWSAPESESAGPTPRPTAADEGTEGAYPSVDAAWKISGVLLLLVLLLVVLLIWQAPAFVKHSVLPMWRTARKLWDTLGQIGDASGGLIVIILVLSIALAGMRGRKKFRQILHELWERLT